MSSPDRLLALLRRRIGDERVLQAIAAVPRECFVGPRERARAYVNHPLSIGCGQTISQPLVVARMCELLSVGPADHVLDVGTGSGYHAAVLARLGARVWSIERHAELAEQAATNLHRAGIGNVTVLTGDGSTGVPEHAPYDAINVAAAAATTVPGRLEQQLARGGRLVVPVVLDDEERLVLVHRDLDGHLRRHAFEAVRFVPLVSAQREV
jgi:protein-L-isoaspartate(D-aspartate) O-methyltransferase